MYNDGSLFFKVPNLWLYEKTHKTFPYVVKPGWHYLFKCTKDDYGIEDDEKNQCYPCTSKPEKLINKLDYIKEKTVLINGNDRHQLEKNCYILSDSIYAFSFENDLPSKAVFLGAVNKNDIIRAKEKYTWSDRDPRIHNIFFNSLWNL